MAYTTIDDPSAYFHIRLYTGNNLTTQTITNNANAGDFQADWLWIKNRDDVEQHHLMDSNRGANKFLHSNSTDDEREGSYNGGHNDINAFGSNGFTITSNGSGDELNFGTRTYVAWQWKANGGTTTSNDASATSVGSIDSVYQANTTAGFSIVTYTGTGSNGTIAHGLGSTPKWYFVKNRSESSVSSTDQSWVVYHSVMAHGAAMFLNTTDSKINHSPFWNSTAPTSTTFSVGTDSRTNTSGDDYIAYCFAEKQGYSKFGSYAGNGSTDGPFVYTGFKPAFVILKRSSGVADWNIFDNKRPNAFNEADGRLRTNDATVESTSDAGVDLLSNGFKCRLGSEFNASSTTNIYMAFAEHPFVSSDGVPTTAR
jgi:hypothetical protein